MKTTYISIFVLLILTITIEGLIIFDGNKRTNEIIKNREVGMRIDRKLDTLLEGQRTRNKFIDEALSEKASSDN